jgi:predicted permease
METLIKDLRYAVRMLFKSKGLTVIAVLSLAIGIGANTAIFGIANAILFRPRPVANPDQLVFLYSGDKEEPFHASSYPSYLDFRERNQVFTDMAAYGISQFKLGGADQVQQVWGEVVSGNYFQVLGVQPVLGRGFLPEEDKTPGTNPVAVISYDLWQRRFNSDPSLIGKTISLNNQTLTVVGVAPQPYTGMMRGLAMDVWVPAMMNPALEGRTDAALLTSRGNRWVTLIGRLKPNTTIDQARARFELLTREMQEAYPEEWLQKRAEAGKGRVSFVNILPESQTRIPPDMYTAAYAFIGLLMVVVNLILVIAGINLASLLLARAVTRRREIAVRLALGASRFRIIRQLLTESVLLAMIAGCAGVLLTLWLLNLLIVLIPPLPEGIRVAFDLSVDWKVLFYALAFSSVTGILFGLVPALQTSRLDLITILKNESGVFAGRYLRSRLKATLVVAQIAFSFLLLIGAGLVLRSLENVRPTRVGFDSTNVLVAPISLDRQYDRAKSQDFYRQLVERVGGLPGVQSVSLVDGMPGGLLGRTRRGVGIEGYTHAPGEDTQVDASIVGPNYFTTLKVPFVAGRDFNDRDREGAPCVAIINEAFIRRYFQGNSQPLGKHLTKYQYQQPNQSCEIVGIVQDKKLQSLEKQPLPSFAFALFQSHRTQVNMLVNTAGDPGNLTAAVRKTIQSLDPQIPVSDVQSVSDSFGAFLYPFRILGVVMGTCGVLALLLASIGIYGVVSFAVAQRTREVGIRMALGAHAKDILKLVVGQCMGMVLFGLGVGLVLSLVLTRVLTSPVFELELLLGVSARDAWTFVGVTVLLTIVALFACYIPARRATKVDPLVALRYE